MMEGMHSWRFTSLKFFVICFCLLVQSISAQEGYLSIACCAESKFTDSNTNIPWIPDSNWFPDTESCHKIANLVPTNDTVYRNVRSFRFDSGKRCYNLPTTEDQDYLIRGTFLPDDLVGSQETSFNVLIDVTPISLVNLAGYQYVEAMFKAKNRYVNFCLEKDKGDPQISQIELRPVNDAKYLRENAEIVLKLIGRVDPGNIGNDIRFQDDIVDRIWKRPDQNTVSESEPISFNVSANAITTVPSKVFQSALTHKDQLEFIHNDLEPQDYVYILFLYFLELDPTVKAGQRVFDVYLNNAPLLENFDILANGSNYREAILNVTANGSLNLTLRKVANGFDFGPILNAYEILQVRSKVPGTNQQDVDNMADVRSQLLMSNKENEALESWSGDPCEPLAWKGVVCRGQNGVPAITRLDLSNIGFAGPIPSGITALTYLTDLNLSNNRFSDKIPEFPLSSLLTSVDLSHNNLSGPLPDSLTALPHLSTLYFGCNPSVSKDLPPSFNSTNLKTDFGECSGQGSGRRTQGIVIGTILCGSFIITVVVGILSIRLCRRRFRIPGKFNRKRYPMSKNVVFSLPSIDDVVVKSINIQMFPLHFIDDVTHKYKTLIGEGGFGSVYRGTLPDGQEVAVKVRSSTSTQGTREFENELNLLSAIRHENLVPLLGYCSDNDQQILVYPFMSNGSLQERLYGEAAKRKPLDWPIRLSIALGAARGLTHLHTFAGRCVIHRDVKSSNILLDNSMNAKVADFGFSKYATQEGDSGASLEVRGTAGYLDPEYYSTQHLSAKSDVFSFGVVLLEIISGREPLNIQRPRNEWSLVEWAKLNIRESKIDEIVDPNIKGAYHGEAMWRVVEVALACTEPFSTYRPCMADIVRELEDALIIENNASEYMKSIDSLYSLGGSNRYSIVMEKMIPLSPTPPTPTEPSPINTQSMAPPEPR